MSRIQRTPSYLLLVGGTYRFRSKVPHDLKAFFGKSEIRVSLRTGYLSKARPKAMRMAGAVRMAYDWARNNDMTKEEIVEWLEREFLQAVETSKFRQIEKFPYRDLHFKDESSDDGTVGKLAILEKFIAGELPHSFVTEQFTKSLTRDHAKRSGMDITPDSDEDLAFFETDLAHWIKCLKIAIARKTNNRVLEREVIKAPKPKRQSVATNPVLEKAQELRKAKKKGLSLSECMRAYVEDKAGSWTERSKQDIVSTLSYLTELFGDIPVKDIDRSMMRSFKEHLSRLPSNRKKKKAYRDLSLKQLLEMDIPAKDLMAPTTKENILTNISSFFSWAKVESYVDENHCVKIIDRADKSQTKTKRPFTSEEMGVLLAKDNYNNQFVRPWMFWIPLICIHTGARLEEIAQLYVADLKIENGIRYFNIDTRDENGNRVADKQLKSGAACRKVPIHPMLLDLGILEFADERKRQGFDRLFPELKLIKDRYGKQVSEWFARYSTRCGVKSKVVDFHSFRRHFINFYKQIVYREDVIKELVGHEIESMSYGLYSNRFNLNVLDEAMQLFKLDMDMLHLYDSKFCGKKGADKNFINAVLGDRKTYKPSAVKKKP